MRAFVLTIPADRLEWAKGIAEQLGGRLMPDALSQSAVLLAAELPKALAPFAAGASGAKGGAEAQGAAGQGAKRPAKAQQRTWALDVPFEGRMLASKLGARWDSGAKCWLFEGEQLPPILAPFKAQSWSWEDAALKARLGIKPAPWEGEDPLIARPHQIVASEAILKAAKAKLPGFLLADEVGLGKTLSAWEGAQAVGKLIGAQSALIVCPLSVQAHWRETLRRQGSSIPQALIINYERLSKLFEMPEGAKAKSKKGLARRASAAAVDIVIFDESHKLKNPTAARSKLAAKLGSNAGFCLWLSATAGQSPLELSYLAPLIAKATGSRANDLKDFEAWCQEQGFKLKRGKFGAWEWAGDREDCDRLAQILFKGSPMAGLRRRPQEIQGWPEISRALFPQALDAKERELYQESWAQFRRSLAEGVSRPAPGAKKKAPLSGLVEALRFRQKSSLLRIGQTVAFALDLFEEGIKPAISCAFLETAQKIDDALSAKGMKVARIDGRLDAAARELERLRFQKGQADAVIFTVEEGISLHQGEHEDVPRSLLIHDLRWSAIQMAQIEGRCHRNGQFAQAYWLVGEGTIEWKVAERVARRAIAMKALSGDVDESLEKEIISELLREAE